MVSLVRGDSRVPRSLACVALLAVTTCTAADRDAAVEVRVRAIEPGAVYAGAGGHFSQLRGLDSLGLKAVLDLDREPAIKRLGTVTRDWDIARDRGIRFIHLPLHPTTPPSVEELDLAVSILNDSATWPIIVHADGADDRTAMVIAAYRIRSQGWPTGRALEEMMPATGRDARSAAWRQRLLEFASASSVERGGVREPR